MSFQYKYYNGAQQKVQTVILYPIKKPFKLMKLNIKKCEIEKIYIIISTIE